jgi:biopolymer transport protein ExbB/TolQ
MQQAIHGILREGGPTIWALMVLAVMIYTLLYSVWRQVGHTRRLVDGHAWEKHRAIDARLPWQVATPPRRQTEREYAAFELDNLAWIERRLPFLLVLVGSAPLLGLLGTVAGMLLTFGGMAADDGGAPIDTISTGISKALVTTQAGLVIAVPAAFLLALLKRRVDTIQLELRRQLHDRLAGYHGMTTT